jgi:hypothetical protein
MTNGDGSGWAGRIVLAGLAASATALALAPTVLASDYSPVGHTTSEAAGQGVPGAWLARSGFLMMGLAVVWLSASAARGWTWVARACHGVFGVCMLAAATFSSRSWRAGAAFDTTEDLLHSVAASAMGVAFAAGVVAVIVSRSARGLGWRVLDVVAVATSVVIPLSMAAVEANAGMLQRVMFVIAYLWYGREAFRSASA